VIARPSLTVTLRELADLADIRGATAEAGDLRRAAAAVDAIDGGEEHIAQLARRDRLSSIPAITPTLHWRVREIVSGSVGAIQDARDGVPFLPRRLLELPALNSSQALVLVRQLGVLTLADLGQAIDDGRVGHQLGADVELRLRAAVEALATEPRRLTLGRTWDLIESVLDAVARACPTLERMIPAGEARRFEPLVSSFVLVGRSPDPPGSLDVICAMPGVDDVLHRSGRRAIVLFQQAEVDVRVAAPDEFGTVLFTATGSRAHAAAMVARRGRPRLCTREEDVYAQAGLPFIAPELRHASGEIEAAESGSLPMLVSREDIRGDLHMHSTYSDGRDTMEQMVAACAALGYEYIAITDHSERATASRTVGADDLARQRDEIERLRERYRGLVILHGIEVDIMPDGRLDFDDDLLSRLDIVLASLHEQARQDGERLTRRCIQAIRHPLVTVVTHPANRLVGRREGYDLDFEAVYAAAAEAGTALEIDGAAGHLDLDGDHARAAVAAGVTVTIDSDCHRAQSLDRQMRFGVGTARRGWVEARHVLNTRPIADVRAFIARKRDS
jgi:DNA polymerase (family 10)